MKIVSWHDDYAIDEDGKRWALSVPWQPDLAGVPVSLQINAEQRKQNWSGVSLTSPTTESTEAWQEKEAGKRSTILEQRRAAKKAKNIRHLAKVKAKHPGEKYDRKRKIWIKDTAYVEA